MAKQTPKQTSDEDERGSLARPPWLPGEKKRRRVHLGRGKDKDVDKNDAGKRADKVEGDADGHENAKPEELTAQAHTRPQRTAAEDAVRESPSQRDRIPVSRARLDSPAEPEAKRDRVPVARPEPDTAAPSQPEADVPPESRPRRVAVRYDRARRLQPDPLPPQPPPPAPPLTPPTQPPVANHLEAEQVSRPEEQPLAAVPMSPQDDGTIDVGQVGSDGGESLSQPSEAEELPVAATTESFAAPSPQVDEWELRKSEIWSTAIELPKESPPASEPEAVPEPADWVIEALARLEPEVSRDPELSGEPAVPAELESRFESVVEPVLPVPFAEPESREPDFELSVEPVAPVEVPAEFESREWDFELSVEPITPVEVPAEFESPVDTAAGPEPVIPELSLEHDVSVPPVPEPAVSAEAQPGPPDLAAEPAVVVPGRPEPEPPVEVSTEREWDADLSAEPESATATSVEPEADDLDDIELRAAALLEQMAAKRAEVFAAPKETDVESISDDGAQEEAGPDWLSTDFVSDVEVPLDSPVEADVESPVETTAENQRPDDAAQTDFLLADVTVESPAEPVGQDQTVDGAEPPSDSTVQDQPLDATVVTPESVEAPSPSQDVPDAAPTAEDRSKGSAGRRPALPPWQTPSSMMSAEIEEVVVDASAAQHGQPPAPAPEQREAPMRHGPPLPGPQPLGPPAQFRPGRRRGAPPPWPPPPPPGPFPPPPWWPGPPPGQRVPPTVRPAATGPAGGQPRREPPAGAPPGRPQPPTGGPPPNYQPFRVPPSIDEAEITHPDRFAPPSGWRRAVHKATSGHVNPGASRKERQQDHLLAEIRQPIVGDFRIAVLSIKGGVGKTTTTFGLGSALATVRHDRVIAVDANPDRGTLGERVGDLSTRSTVRDLLSDPNINRYADVRNHTLMATSRLEVLASEQDPAVSEVFGADDYRRTVDILRHFYNIILTDCGTGIMHSAMSAILDLAHSIVLVSSPAIDAARSASATLDWLMQHGHSGLVREAHVVLSASRPGSAALKLDKVYEHFQSRCRSIHLIPFDPHLAEGADVDFGRLNPPTRQAYLELAGAVAENFGRLRGPREQS